MAGIERAINHTERTEALTEHLPSELLREAGKQRKAPWGAQGTHHDLDERLLNGFEKEGDVETSLIGVEGVQDQRGGVGRSGRKGRRAWPCLGSSLNLAMLILLMSRPDLINIIRLAIRIIYSGPASC